ncbi:MAG: DUF4402 domain-containing protein [Pseudomonadota bacterium]
MIALTASSGVRTLLRFLCAAALLASSAGALQAQTATTQSTVQIQGDTRITKLGDLNFGQIIPGASGGTITVAPNGNVSTSGTLVAADTAQTAASFELEREILQDFPTYEGPDGTDTIEITHTSIPTARMTVRDFTTDFNRPGFFGLPAYFFRTTFDFRVGGTLDVASDQEPGLYVGTFTVTIDYN